MTDLNTKKIVSEILRAHNLTAQDFADRIGVSRQSVYGWEQGKPVSRRMLRQMELLGLIEIETIPEQVIVRVVPSEKKTVK